MSADLGKELQKARKALEKLQLAQDVQARAVLRLAAHLASIDASLDLVRVRKIYMEGDEYTGESEVFGYQGEIPPRKDET